jgi:diphosphomevalonate decarboxylase
LLAEWDLERVGELMEANTLAMHACMLATRPPLLYWQPATLAVLHAVRRWRGEGLAAYATVDAGAQVAVLCRREDLRRLASRIRRFNRLEGIAGSVIASLPGGAAVAVVVGS